jgi:hypothetical protein
MRVTAFIKDAEGGTVLAGRCGPFPAGSQIINRCAVAPMGRAVVLGVRDTYTESTSRGAATAPFFGTPLATSRSHGHKSPGPISD